MSKTEWLFYLRKCHKINTLEFVIYRKAKYLSDYELMDFLSAADHRRAELVMGCLYDRIPKYVWHYVK